MRYVPPRALPRPLRRAALRAAASLGTAREAREAARLAAELRLADVRRRLEILVTALHGRPFSVEPAPAPKRPGWVQAARRLPSRFLHATAPAAGNAGERILLPPSLPVTHGRDDALARYRALALGQAERVARGTGALVPADDEPLVRDLYLLAESVAADHALVARVESIAATVRDERARALAARPPLGRLRAAEREVERLVRGVLAADPARPDAALVPVAASADASLAWARETAARVAGARRYRGTAPVALWGSVARGPRAAWLLSMHEQALGGGLSLDVTERATLGGHAAIDAEIDADTQRTAGDQAEVDAGAPPDARGGPGGDPGDADADGAGNGPGSPSADVTADADRDPLTGRRLPPGVVYPEWDGDAGAYRPRGATVRPWTPDAADDGAWADAVLDAHAPLVRLVRQRFERLRARRLRLGRQRDGDDLDLQACVEALVAHRAGEQPDDRLYAQTRPARRGLAVLLLVDASGSTSSEVAPGLRVIDVERVAALLAGEAFDALGDLFAVHAFSGVGAHNVRAATLKDFGERNGPAVRRRVSALAPDGNTRLGAAIRHASAALARQPAGHRLLVVLSDGRPNDMDGYHEQYAVEDARRAVVEARAIGVRPFCLTVDREDAAYLPRIFGPAGHTMVRHPDHVPEALLSLVRQLASS